MAIQLAKIDERLNDSPEGRFVLAVCQRLAALTLDGLNKLHARAAWDLSETPQEPCIVVAPQLEQFLDVEDSDGADTGKGFVAIYAAGLMTIEPVDAKKPPMFGRHLGWRHQQLVEFGAVEKSRIVDAETGNPFDLNVTPNLKFPRRAIKRGLLLSFVTVFARYQEC